MQNPSQPRQHSQLGFTGSTLFGDPGRSSSKFSEHRLTFIDDQQDIRRLSAESAAKHRHAIFTEAEREDMSEEIINSVVGRDPDRALLDLERFESSGNNISSFSMFHGPFGISKLSQSSNTKAESHEIEKEILPIESWLLESDAQLFPAGEAEYTGIVLGANVMPNDESILWDFITSGANGDEYSFQMPQIPQIPTEPLPVSAHESAETWSLLSHYRDRVVPLISPFEQGQEDPWRKLVIPCAVSSLGELILKSTISHARLTLLNAVLSASSFHLGQHSETCAEYWTTTGNSYLKLAQSHLVHCAEKENMCSPRKSKYKEVLMALLGLSTAYMIKGDSEKRLSCLIQAEKFISVNGFTQSTVSSKRRTLHHCYAYMRIMAETTSIDSLCTSMANASIETETSFETMFRICPGVTFSGDMMAMEKEPGVAQRDLHLAIPGRWSLTLFPKMYGVAESFLMLLSQVIRLANERELSMTGDREGALSLKDFWNRAKVLERGIHLLVSSCRTNSTLDTFVGENGFESARAQAMYTALLIFFHRRIYDIEAFLLQKEVDAVKDSLSKAQEVAGCHYGSTATLIWPAFIAACEAVDPESELFFTSWFDCCYKVTGLGNVSLAKQVFEMIWNRRRETGLDDKPCGWPEILRTKNIRLSFI